MSGEAYEILALLMRYVFALIGALIVFRSFIWLRKDARAYRKEMKTLPDAGLVGEIVDLNTGKAQPLPREGVIGSARECDIRVKGDGVLRRHARLEFTEGKGKTILLYASIITTFIVGIVIGVLVGKAMTTYSIIPITGIYLAVLLLFIFTKEVPNNQDIKNAE